METILRTCTKCSKSLPETLEYFGYWKIRNCFRTQCKICRNKYDKLYRLNNPNLIKKQYKKSRSQRTQKHIDHKAYIMYLYNIKKKYKLSEQQLRNLMDKQRGCCAICKETLPLDKRIFVIDHDHETGKVRGLLCSLCNVGIGMLGDNTESLYKAYKYLKNQ